MLQRLIKCKAELVKLVSDEEYKQWVKKLPAEQREKARGVKLDVLCDLLDDEDDREDSGPSFWLEAEFTLEVLLPVYTLLRKTDTSAPVMGDIYLEMSEVQRLQVMQTLR